MSEADEVANFLLSTDGYVAFALGRLNFSVDAFRVDTQGYREIAHKIRQGAITVSPVQSSPGSLIAAAYTPGRNLLSVPANLDLHTPRPARTGNQSMIVHEVTHALVDFHRFACTGAVNEACAYIAGQVYALSLSLRQSSTEPLTNAIISAAQAVVTGRSMVYQASQHLSSRDPDIVVLLQAITAHTNAYPDASVRRVPDGIRGGLMNPWYMPRH